MRKFFRVQLFIYTEGQGKEHEKKTVRLTRFALYGDGGARRIGCGTQSRGK